MDELLQGTEYPVCMGCELPIAGKPFTHHSVLGVHFIAHDFECCLVAHEKETNRLLSKGKTDA